MYIKRIIESRFIQFKRKNFLGIFKEIYWLWNALLILLNCLLHNLLSFSYIPEMSQQASFLPPPFLSLFLPCLILLSLPSFLCAQFYLTFNPVFSFLCCNSYFFFNLFIFNWRIIVLQNCVGFCHTSTWAFLKTLVSKPLMDEKPCPLFPPFL